MHIVEWTTFFSTKIVLYSVYVPLRAITLFKNNATMRQVELCFVQAWYTTSLGKQLLQAFKLARGLPFRTELSSIVHPRWLGMKREYVHLFSSCTYTTYVGLCERDTNVERYSVWVHECSFGGMRDREGICVDDISIKKCNICNVCEIESCIYHIYRERGVLLFFFFCLVFCFLYYIFISLF